MKLVKLMAVSITVAMLIVAQSSTAEAQRYHHYRTSHHKVLRSNVLPKNIAARYIITDCDNNGRCREQTVTKKEARVLTTRHRSKKQLEEVAHLDPNGNAASLLKDTHELLPNGMVRVTTAYGKPITVNPVDASKFLKFFALLKEKNYKINWNLVGCFSSGHKSGSNHRIGRACDIQTGWNRGPAFIYTKEFARIVKLAGLYSGCAYNTPDCGHVEAIHGLYNARPNLYTSLAKFQADQSTARYQP